MQDYNQNRKGRSLRRYCKDEAVDYDWLIQYKKTYPLQEKKRKYSFTFAPGITKAKVG